MEANKIEVIGTESFKDSCIKTEITKIKESFGKK